MLHFLIPIDFSPCSANAALYAARLANLLKARLTLLHVLSIPHIDPNMPIEMATQIQEDQEHKARSACNELMGEVLKNVTVSIACELRQGFFLAELEAFIDSEQPDWVIMGTQGATGLKKLVGSNTSNAIERLRIPVLAIPAETTYKPPKQLLYCTDLRSDDYHYVDQLLKIADHLQAHITCLHVCKPDQGINQVSAEDFKEFFWKELKGALSFATIEDADMEAAIDQYAQTHDIDWVAMLTHRRTLLEKIFHKSTTRKMVIHTSLPLLAFHK